MTATDAMNEAVVQGFFSASYQDWALLESYYKGDHPHAMLTDRQKASGKFGRFWSVVNVCAVIVDEPVGYLVNAEVKVRVPGQPVRAVAAAAVSAAEVPAAPPLAPDTAPRAAEPSAGQQAPAALPSPGVLDAIGTPNLSRGGGTTSPIAEWAVSFLKTRVKPKGAELLKAMGIFGEGYIYAYVDDQGLSRGIKLRAIAPMEDGQERVKVDLSSDEEEVVQAQIQWREKSPLFEELVMRRVTLSAARIVQEERGRDRGDGSVTNWAVTSREANSYGVTPLVRFVNPTPSDLSNIRPLQDDLNKSAYDIRVTREYHGFPMLASADGTDAATVEIGPGKVLKGTWNRIEAGDLSQLLNADSETMSRIALLSASLVLQEKGGEAPSGLALSYLQQSFRFKLRAKADALEAGYAMLLTLVARMIFASEGLYELEQPTDAAGNLIPREAFAAPKFLIEVIPEEIQDKAAQMQADLAAVAAEGMSKKEFARRNGMDPYVQEKEIEQERASKLAMEARYAIPQEQATQGQSNEGATGGPAPRDSGGGAGTNAANPPTGGPDRGRPLRS